MTISALPIEASVGVVGAGAMGAGIARVAAEAGHTVYLYDTSDEAVARAREDVEKRLAKEVEKGRLTAAEAALIAGRVVPSGDLADLAPSGLVVEAIVEDLAIKRDLLARVESIVAPEAILATNTSSLSVTALAAALQTPGRLVGMHFFNPAPVLPLVEIVSGLATDPAVADACFATAASWGKAPVHCSSTPGFIVNRVARPFYGEALRVLAEGGADVATIDHVVEGAGRFRMGPFTLMDLVGLDVNLAVSRSVYEQTFHDSRFSPSPVQQALVDAGRLGRKSERGFYDYGSGTEAPSPAVVDTNPFQETVTVHGDLGWAGVVLDRLQKASAHVEFVSGPSPGFITAADVVIVPTDGRTATRIASGGEHDTSNIVVLDLLRPGATRVAIAVADQAEAGAAATAAAVLEAAGLTASPVADTPALVLMRIVTQLASVAADAALLGVAAPGDIDRAMKLGTSYPVGPLELADDLGAGVVVAVLDNLAGHYGEDRYRSSPALRRAALTGRSLLGEGEHDE